MIEIPVEIAGGVQHQQEVDIGVFTSTPPCYRAEQHDSYQVRLKLREDGIEWNRIPRAALSTGRRWKRLLCQRSLERQYAGCVQ